MVIEIDHLKDKKSLKIDGVEMANSVLNFVASLNSNGMPKVTIEFLPDMLKLNGEFVVHTPSNSNG